MTEEKEPTIAKIDGKVYVYIDEEHVVEVKDLLEFVREREPEFYLWRAVWGDKRMASRLLQ